MEKKISKVKELKPRQGNVNIRLNIIDKGEIREFEKFGRTGRVANMTGKDDDGDEVTLTVWNEKIDEIDVGDYVNCENCYVTEFKDQIQLTAGKYGAMKIEKMEETVEDGDEEDFDDEDEGAEEEIEAPKLKNKKIKK